MVAAERQDRQAAIAEKNADVLPTINQKVFQSI